MPQLILSSETKGEFPSFVIDIDNQQLKHLTWIDVFNVISIKLKFPIKHLYIKSNNGVKVSKKNINKFTFDIDNYRMQYQNSTLKNNDFWFSFGTKI
jgi:hypothetical protein